jgi:hypothetical protein
VGATPMKVSLKKDQGKVSLLKLKKAQPFLLAHSGSGSCDLVLIENISMAANKGIK